MWEPGLGEVKLTCHGSSEQLQMNHQIFNRVEILSAYPNFGLKPHLFFHATSPHVPEHYFPAKLPSPSPISPQSCSFLWIGMDRNQKCLKGKGVKVWRSRALHVSGGAQFLCTKESVSMLLLCISIAHRQKQYRVPMCHWYSATSVVLPPWFWGVQRGIYSISWSWDWPLLESW